MAPGAAATAQAQANARVGEVRCVASGSDPPQLHETFDETGPLGHGWKRPLREGAYIRLTIRHAPTRFGEVRRCAGAAMGRGLSYINAARLKFIEGGLTRRGFHVNAPFRCPSAQEV